MAAPIRTPRLQLVPLEPAVIKHLIDGEREEAERLVGATLPQEFPNRDELAGFLPVQLRRMESVPDRRQWMARLIRMRDRKDNKREVVGHCGFHGPPEIIGRAEIGYTVFTAYRGQGYATEAARALVDWAFEQGESRVFASISPENAPSLAVVRKLGFTQVGTQEDEVDGLELVFAVERSWR